MKMNLIVFQKWWCLLIKKTLGMNDAEPPGPARANLTFCTAPEYAANGCCSAQDDTTLSTTFKSMNISDANCAAVVKQILCSVSLIPTVFEMIIDWGEQTMSSERKVHCPGPDELKLNNVWNWLLKLIVSWVAAHHHLNLQVTSVWCWVSVHTYLSRFYIRSVLTQHFSW